MDAALSSELPRSNSELPALESAYALPPEAVTSYAANGHVLLRGLASAAEVAAYAPAIERTAYNYNTERRPLEERNTYSKAFLQIGNLWERDQVVQRFVFARRFARVAAALMGVAGVRLYHDQALFKEPGGGHTPWHQDQFYWPLDMHTITLWMPLCDVSDDMGLMRFASGSHKEGSHEALEISDESEERLSKRVRERGFPVVPGVAMRAGDVTFHSGWTLHSAPHNATSRMRPAMTIIYMPDGVRAREPEHDRQENDLRTWLPGCKPGDLAKSPLNPLLWSAA